MDWDEELKRQAAISALLAPPEDVQAPPLDTQTDEQVTAEPDVLKPDKSDWHKLADQTFPKIAEDQPEGLPKATTIAEDQPQGLPPVYPNLSLPPPEPADIKVDEDTGTRYVQDPLEGKIPHAELATAADKEAFKPSDVTLPEETAIGTGVPIEVRRGERVLEVPKPTPESSLPEPVPGFVESSKNAILNPAAGVIPPTPVDKYPDKIVTPDEAAGKTSVVDAVPQPAAAPAVATPSPVAPAVAAAPADQGPVIQPSSDDWNKLADSIWPSGKSPAAAADTSNRVVMDGGASLKGTDGRITDIVSNAARILPAGYTIRPTSGVRTAGQGQHTLGKAQDWQIYGPDGKPVVNRGDDTTGLYTQLARAAYGYQEKNYPELTGQFQWGGQFGTSTANNPNEPDLMHFDIGGRRGRIERYSRESIGAVLPPDAGTAAADKDVATTLDNNLGGLLTNKGAVFEEMGKKYGVDPKLIAAIAMEETGNGTSNLLATRNNIGGVTGPGHDGKGGNYMPYATLDEGIEAAAKLLRKRYLDQGLTSIDQIGSVWAPPDASNDPQGTNVTWPTAVSKFYAVLGGKGQLDTRGAESKEQSMEDLAKDWIKISPEEQAAADAQGQANRTKILTDLQNKAPNLPAFMQALENPIQGISDTDRNAKAAEIKKQLTIYAQDYYKEPNPDKAYARVMAAAANPAGTAAGELVSKLGPNFMHAWLSLKQQTDSPIQTRLIDFINTVQPDASPEDRTNLIKQVMSKTGKDRVDFVNHLYNAGLQTHPDTVKNVNMMSLLDSIDVASQPGMEAKMDQYHTWVQGMVAQNLKDLREDPSLEHTALGSVANAAPAMIKNIAEVAIPYIGQSAMLSEVYTDTLDGLRREHPELSEDQLKAMAASKSLPQAILQELVNAGTMGVGGSALKGVQNPIARIISSGIAHGVVGGTAGTAQQALSNVMTGRPAGEGLQEAGTTAFIQSFLGGAWGGRHGEAEAPPPGEPTPAVPLTQDTKLPRNVVGGGAETAVPSEPTPILTPNRAVRTSDVLGQEPGDQHVVSSTDVLGHQEDYTPQEPIPWFKQGVTPAERHDPLVIRGGERTAFTPQELSDIVNRLPSNATPAEVARVLDQVRSPTGVHLGEESTGEVQRAQAVQEQPGPVQFWKSDRQRTLAEQAWIKANAGEPVDNAIAKAKAAASLGGAPAAPTTPQAKPQAKQMRPGPPPPVNGNISGEDPHIVRESNKTTVNGVANRYVAERVAGGELPPTDPNIGVTTEELLARGAKMGPDEINKHVSDLMEGKVNNPRDMAAAVRAKERELTQRSRQLGILSEENPGDAQAKLEAGNALAKLHDFHSEGGPIKKMKEIFNHIGVGLQGDLQYDLSSENGLKEKFFQESKGKKAPPQAGPAIKETAARVRRAYSEDYQAKKRVSAEVDKWLGKKMSDQQIEETRQAALKKMNMDPC